MDYTVDALIEKVKTYAAIPTGQPAFSNARLVEIMNDELLSCVFPWIIKLQQEYFIDYKDYTIDASEPEYMVPTRAYGNVLRQVKYLVDDDETFNERDLPQFNPEMINNILLPGFYMRGSNIHLVNFQNIADRPIRLYYYRRPNELVLSVNCAEVTNVVASGSPGYNTITVGAYPAAWAGEDVLVDFIKGNPHFDSLEDDHTVTNFGSSFDLPNTVAISIGDWVCAAGETPVPQIPAEAKMMLVQLTVARIMEALGDAEGMKAAIDKYTQLEQRMSEALSPRIVGSPIKIMNFESFA